MISPSPLIVFMVWGTLRSRYEVHCGCLSTVVPSKDHEMASEWALSLVKASREPVQRANPDLTACTSRRSEESCPRRFLRAVRTANRPALQEMWSGSTCTKSRVSGRVGGCALAGGFGFVVFCGRGGGVSALWAYVGPRVG